jgi:protein-disulfide isomerase
VRIAYKHFPLSFHPAAKPAAIASVAAQEQGKFWEFHDVIFEATTKRQLKGSDEDMLKYAEQAGLDMDQFKADMAANKADYEKRVNADYVEGQKVQVRGTPTLYLNGKKVRNRSQDGLSATIDEMLKAPDKG